jgi:D-alanine transfer protein
VSPQRAAAAATSAALHQSSRLVAGLLAATLYIAAGCLALVLGDARVRNGIHVIAPLNFANNWRGEVVQREMLRHADLLPMYGSSELVVEVPNRASDFFASYPTGFAVAPIGRRGTPPIAMLFQIAAMDRAVTGRRIVVSASGTWFLSHHRTIDRQAIAANGSALQTGDVVFFRSTLPAKLRRRIAQRVAHIPEVSEHQLLVRVPLGCIADHCIGQPFIPVLTPLWLLRSLPLRIDDRLRASVALWRAAPPPPRVARRVDWSLLEAEHDRAWRAGSANNAFGIDSAMWAKGKGVFLARQGVGRDSAFLKKMRAARRWDDLALLLETLEALGARPLILNTPLKGVFWDFAGVSASARVEFYQRFDSITARFPVRAENFRAYDADPYFLIEPGSHLSQKGWLIYDQVIDAYYHAAR